MDSDQEGQSNYDDDVKPAEQPAQMSNVDGFVVSPHPASPASDFMNNENHQDAENQAATPTAEQPAVKDAKPKAKKGTVVWLIIFIILFIAAAAAAGYFYTKYNKDKTDLKNAQNTSAQLQSQLNSQTSAASQDTTLTKQNTTLQANITTQTAYITNLGKVAQQLKTTCGTACKDITIPTAPAI